MSIGAWGMGGPQRGCSECWGLFTTVLSDANRVNQTHDLIGWIRDIQKGMYMNLHKSYMFKNYPDQALSATNFYNSASTALMANTIYHLSTLANIHTTSPTLRNSAESPPKMQAHLPFHNAGPSKSTKIHGRSRVRRAGSLPCQVHPALRQV